ncbi:MAG: hypothetical protein KIT40_18815 [Nitrospira sp.]|nr:hypothetical protein [Nitrospira sp.]
MARAKATEASRSKAKPNAVDELTRGIATLRELSVQIDDLSRDGFPYREAVRARTELSFRETIRRLFGEKSPEYQTHKNHKLKVGTRAESAQSTALLKEFIAALEIQKADLLGLKPEKVIAVVTAESAHPSLTMVPPFIASDSNTMSSAGSPAPPAAIAAPIPPTTATIASAGDNPPSSSQFPSSATSRLVAASTSSAVSDTMPPPVRDTLAPRSVQAPSSASSTPAESAQISQLSPTPSPVTPPPLTTGIASAIPSGTSVGTTRATGEATILTTTIPPIASTRSTVPQGTIPPVPHTTLRPRPAPLVTAGSPAPAQPVTHVLPTPTLTPPPAPAPEPPQKAAPSFAATTSDSSPVAVQDNRTAPPLVQSMVATPTSTIPAPQQETPAPPSVTEVPAPVRSSAPASAQIPSPEKAPEARVSAEHGTLEILRRVCTRFHLVARQLRLRKEYRPTLEITDEYDLQDLFYALLRLQFDEVGTEEWTPAYTSGAPRTSYLLDWEKTVVVVKQTRSGLTTKDLAEQIAADTARYSARPNGANLVCFVYDPDGRVGNPRGLEADRSSTEGTYRVEVIVAPK